MEQIGPIEIAQELEEIVNEFSGSDEYLQGVDALLNLWYRRSMMSEEMQKNIEYELVYHYENIKLNTVIVEEDYQPSVVKTRTLEWL
jgi:hypothetical protein